MASSRVARKACHHDKPPRSRSENVLPPPSPPKNHRQEYVRLHLRVAIKTYQKNPSPNADASSRVARKRAKKTTAIIIIIISSLDPALRVQVELLDAVQVPPLPEALLVPGGQAAGVDGEVGLWMWRRRRTSLLLLPFPLLPLPLLLPVEAPLQVAEVGGGQPGQLQGVQVSLLTILLILILPVQPDGRLGVDDADANRPEAAGGGVGAGDDAAAAAAAAAAVDWGGETCGEVPVGFVWLLRLEASGGRGDAVAAAAVVAHLLSAIFFLSSLRFSKH